jgi:hypothetical protein
MEMFRCKKKKEKTEAAENQRKLLCHVRNNDIKVSVHNSVELNVI